MDTKLEKKLSKLLSLAERGVGGEKENAQRMLDDLLVKHGVTIEQLTDEVRETRWIKWTSGKWNQRLLSQVMTAVTSRNRKQYTSSGRRGQLGCDMTVSEHLEAELQYRAYKAAFKDQIDILFTAFIHKHNIFPPPEDEHEEEEKPLTPEETARIKQAGHMAMVMPSVSIRRELTE